MMGAFAFKGGETRPKTLEEQIGAILLAYNSSYGESQFAVLRASAAKLLSENCSQLLKESIWQVRIKPDNVEFDFVDRRRSGTTFGGQLRALAEDEAGRKFIIRVSFSKYPNEPATARASKVGLQDFETLANAVKEIGSDGKVPDALYGNLLSVLDDYARRCGPVEKGQLNYFVTLGLNHPEAYTLELSITESPNVLKREMVFALVPTEEANAGAKGTDQEMLKVKLSVLAGGTLIMYSFEQDLHPGPGAEEIEAE